MPPIYVLLYGLPFWLRLVFLSSKVFYETQPTGNSARATVAQKGKVEWREQWSQEEFLIDILVHWSDESMEVWSGDNVSKKTSIYAAR
jgi:hypothetical protein